MNDLAVNDGPLTAFRNEPPIDFAREENRQAMNRALAEVESQLGGEYPLAIGGESVTTDEQLTSVDPSSFATVVGTASSGGVREGQTAVAAARAALPSWRATPVGDRAALLRKVAQRMRDRFFELAAWQIFECGKPWREATADVCEAIDFCEYYALGAEFLFSPQSVAAPGEDNRFLFTPRGVAAVIAPWNFPLAILTGMTVAALVTGNTVVMKPAEQSSVMAAKLMELLAEAGLPPGVCNFLPGPGETAGAALVEHRDVALIAFTGSRQVGLSINLAAARVSAAGSRHVKHVIAEMGGKNAILVDQDADLDEAVIGITQSAFGYQGQKCSACSRVIALESVHDALLERLVEAARSLRIGPAKEPGVDMGPLIDAAARDKTREYIEIARGEGRCVLESSVGDLAERGYFVGPHIFADVEPTSRIAQEEVFGPVLAVMRAKDLSRAFEIANSTDYALTGGIFSRSPASLERAAREMRAGNLYINRNITGALVGRQPFGGFRMSGLGSKAGGPDYLHQFVLPRTITENTMRRGFAPPAD